MWLYAYNIPNLCVCSLAGIDYVGVEKFVENTKQYAEGISPTPAMEGVAGDDDDDDDEGPVKNPDELPLHQKVSLYFCLNLRM